MILVIRSQWKWITFKCVAAHARGLIGVLFTSCGINFKTSRASDADTAAWLGRIDNSVYDKFAAGDSWNHAAGQCLAVASLAVIRLSQQTIKPAGR